MSDTASIVDARGRKIEVRNLKPLDSMQMAELVGPQNAENKVYLGYAALAYSVVSIDGSPVGRLGTKLALEAVVKELDSDGFEAVGKAIEENFLRSEGADSEAAVKNG